MIKEKRQFGERLLMVSLLEEKVKELSEQNEKLEAENDQLLYLERLGLEYKAYEGRLQELRVKEQQLDQAINLHSVNQAEIDDLRSQL